jgi:hypothetical protein
MYVGGHEAQQTAADGVFRTSRRPTQENKEERTTPACDQRSQAQNMQVPGNELARWTDLFSPFIGPRG